MIVIKLSESGGLDQAINAIRHAIAEFMELPATQSFEFERLLLQHHLEGCDTVRDILAETGSFYDETLNTEYPCCTANFTLENSSTGDSTQLWLSYYFERSGHPCNHSSLCALDADNNIIIWYSQEHDLKEQWYINCFAQDLVDEQGEFLYDAEPVQI